MRAVTRRFGTLLSVVLLATASGAVADVARDLARVESRGLAKISSERLVRLARAPDVPLLKTAAGGATAQFSEAWLRAQPKASGSSEWRCLSEALYFEARGETIKGQFAVAEVIRNRVKSARFPGSFCGVINQGTGKKYQCQFTYTCDGRAEVINEPGAFRRVGKIARAVIDGKAPDVTNGATHYHTTAVRPRWASVYTRTASIGVHRFYRHTWKKKK